MIAKTPEPPYYMVVFTSVRTDGDSGYTKMAEKMDQLVRGQDGFLGVESAREEVGITVSYWKDLESIRNWKKNIDHLEALQKGKSTWYKSYKTRIAKVERDYGFQRFG